MGDGRRYASSRTGSAAPIARPPWRAPAPAPDRGAARFPRSSAAAARAASRRSSPPAPRAASPSRSLRRGSTSSQREPSLDRLARGERQARTLTARGSSRFAGDAARHRLHCPSAREIGQMEAARCRRAAGTRSAPRCPAGRSSPSNGLRPCRRGSRRRAAARRCPASSANSGPARENSSALLPFASAEPIHAGSRVSPRRAGRGIAWRRSPSRRAKNRSSVRQRVASAESLRLAVGKRRHRAIAEHGDQRQDREREQHLDQREACPSPVEGPRRRMRDSSRLRRAADVADQAREHVIGTRALGDRDLDAAKRRIRRTRRRSRAR